MKYFNSVYILILLLFSLILFGCDKQKEKTFLRVEVYYIISDSIFGDKPLTRVLIKIPKDKVIEMKIGEKIRICFEKENDSLVFSSVMEGRGKCGNYLEGQVIHLGDDSTISVKPDFSPLNFYDKKLSYDNKTKFLLLPIEINKTGKIVYAGENPILIEVQKKRPIFFK